MRIVSRAKDGYIILLLTISVLILCFSSAQVFFSAAFVEYKTASHQANYTKAKYLAQSGVEAALVSLNKLEKFGFFDSPGPKPLPFGGHTIVFEVEDLNGRLNVNALVNIGKVLEETNGRQRARLTLLSEYLKISPDIWDAVIDWVDPNNVPEPYGYERTHYESLQPPRKIRNGHIHSLEELLLIPGFTHKVLFTDLRTEDEKKEIENIFRLEEENLVNDRDFILANNLTYQLSSSPDGDSSGDSININSAPYLVLLSMHESMTPEIVRDILRKRREKSNKLESDDLKDLGVPEEMYNGVLGSQFIYKSVLCQIRASAIVNQQIAQITITYDRERNDVVDYAE